MTATLYKTNYDLQLILNRPVYYYSQGSAGDGSLHAFSVYKHSDGRVYYFGVANVGDPWETGFLFEVDNVTLTPALAMNIFPTVITNQDILLRIEDVWNEVNGVMFNMLDNLSADTFSSYDFGHYEHDGTALQYRMATSFPCIVPGAVSTITVVERNDDDPLPVDVSTFNDVRNFVPTIVPQWFERHMLGQPDDPVGFVMKEANPYLKVERSIGAGTPARGMLGRIVDGVDGDAPSTLFSGSFSRDALSRSNAKRMFCSSGGNISPVFCEGQMNLLPTHVKTLATASDLVEGSFWPVDFASTIPKPTYLAPVDNVSVFSSISQMPGMMPDGDKSISWHYAEDGIMGKTLVPTIDTYQGYLIVPTRVVDNTVESSRLPSLHECVLIKVAPGRYVARVPPNLARVDGEIFDGDNRVTLEFPFLHPGYVSSTIFDYDDNLIQGAYFIVPDHPLLDKIAGKHPYVCRADDAEFPSDIDAPHFKWSPAKLLYGHWNRPIQDLKTAEKLLHRIKVPNAVDLWVTEGLLPLPMCSWYPSSHNFEWWEFLVTAPCPSSCLPLSWACMSANFVAGVAAEAEIEPAHYHTPGMLGFVWALMHSYNLV